MPEIPRVVRLLGPLVLSTRELAFVEAAVSSGRRDLKIIRRHILASTIAPLTVPATYIIAAAILIEASLSFLGITPDELAVNLPGDGLGDRLDPRLTRRL
ncbi:ABC-type dipeptide/oligopeptide/nickel transport system permease subunit [Bradyrhizobium sp. USDA 4518]